MSESVDGSSRQILTGWLRDLSSHERGESEKLRKGSVPVKSKEEEKRMKKYEKPSLTALGLLRVVTQQFSDCGYGNTPSYFWYDSRS